MRVTAPRKEAPEPTPEVLRRLTLLTAALCDGRRLEAHQRADLERLVRDLRRLLE
jgi:hypothetical protein